MSDDAARVADDSTDLRAFVKAARELGRSHQHGEEMLPKHVRQFIRRQLIPELIPRMFRVAMGTATFTIATEEGKLVEVPAFASVQMDTAKALVEWGIGKRPLVTDDETRRPGIVILGTMEQLGQAQQAAEKERLRAAGLLEDITPVVTNYLAPPGHEVVYVDEHTGTEPVVAASEAPLTQKARDILARRAKRGQHAPGHDG